MVSLTDGAKKKTHIKRSITQQAASSMMLTYPHLDEKYATTIVSLFLTDI